MTKYIHKPKIMNVFARLTETREGKRTKSISYGDSTTKAQYRNADLHLSKSNLDDYCPVENHKEQTGSSINLKLSLNRKKNIKSKLKLKKKELKKNMFQSESNKCLIDQIFVPSSLSRVPSHLITTRDSKEDSFDDQKTAENMNSNRLNSMFEATAEKRPLTSYNITYDHRK